MDEPAIIEVDQVAKRFDRQIVLDGISFTVHHGETLVVLGRSGTGKSVLLRCLIGLMQPSAGTCRILGRDLNALPESARLRHRRKIGYVFQGAALFDSLTILENVGFPLFEARLPADKIRKRVGERLRMVGLEHTIDMVPSELSGGMRKRAALARAIIDLPEVVLYDEPTTGLDPLTTDVINQIILRLRSALGVTSVVVTHDIKSAFTIADRIIMLDQGRIVTQGSPEEIESTTQPWVRNFIEGHALESEAVETGMFAIGGASGIHSLRHPTAAVPTVGSDESGHQLSASKRMSAIRNRPRRKRDGDADTHG